MKIKTENIALCTDCMYVFEFGLDDTELEGTERGAEIVECLKQFGYLAAVDPNDADFSHDADFSREPCGCCGATMGGSRHYYSELTEGEP